MNQHVEEAAGWIGCALMLCCFLPLLWRRLHLTACERPVTVFYDSVLVLIGLSAIAHLCLALDIGNYRYAPGQTTYLARNMEWAATSPIFLLVMTEMARRLERRDLTAREMGAVVLAPLAIMLWLFSVFARVTNPAQGALVFAVVAFAFALIAGHVVTYIRRPPGALPLEARRTWQQVLTAFTCLWVLYPGIYTVFQLGIITHTQRVLLYTVLDVIERGLVSLALLSPVLLRCFLRTDAASERTTV